MDGRGVFERMGRKNRRNVCTNVYQWRYSLRALLFCKILKLIPGLTTVPYSLRA
jgi:hypothetical protein